MTNAAVANMTRLCTFDDPTYGVILEKEVSGNWLRQIDVVKLHRYTAPVLFSSLRKFGILGVLAAPNLTFCQAEFRYRADMFDFDQRRATLPNDGSMYCVPTSFTNNLAYLNKYGMPSMLNGTNTNSHTEMTGLIFQIGFLMGCDPADGVTHFPYEFEWDWVDDHTSKLVYFGAYGNSSTWGFNTIMNRFRDGSLVRMAYGKYANVNGTWFRVGGHSVTLGGYIRDDGPDNDSFFVADPSSDDGNLNVQSPFIFNQKETENITLNINGIGSVTHARYTYYTGPNGNNRRVVDSMTTIHPVYAGWIAPSRAGNVFNVRFQYMPQPPTTGEFPMSYSFVTTDTIQDWCFDPAEFGVCYVSSTGAVKKRSIAVADEVTILQSAAAKKVAVGGPDQDVFVLRQGATTDSVTRVARNGGPLVSFNLGRKVAAIDVGGKTGGLVALDLDLKGTTVFDRDFTASHREPLRPFTPTPPPTTIAAGAGLLSIDSRSGVYFVAEKGSQQWIQYRRFGSQRMGAPVNVSVPGGIQALMAGPQGTVFVQGTDRILRTYNADGTLRATEFSGYQAGGEFRIPKTFVMAKPELMTGPGWENLWPPED